MIPVTELCLVPFNFATYRDQVWCDILPIDVGHILLGLLWLYNHDVTHSSHPNTYTFMHDKKRVMLRPHKPKSIQYASSQPKSPKETTVSKENSTNITKVELTKLLHLLNKKQLCQEASSGIVYTLIVWELEKIFLDLELPLNLWNLLFDYSDLILDELLDELSPTRDIQHVIDLVPRSYCQTCCTIDWILRNIMS